MILQTTALYMFWKCVTFPHCPRTDYIAATFFYETLNSTMTKILFSSYISVLLGWKPVNMSAMLIVQLVSGWFIRARRSGLHASAGSIHKRLPF